MWQRPLNGRHGFICHDACWSVLQVLFPLLHLQVALVSRLLEVCRSCPVKNMSLLDWGHNYGGLIGADRAASCLWDESYVEVSAQSPERVLQDACANPFDVPEMQEILDGTRQCPPPRDRFSFKAPIPLRHSGEKDCFARLPPEILQEIAIYLPTPQVMNLRLSTMAFAILQLSQQFWASRFNPTFERDFVFETRGDQEHRNWKSLYFQTSDVYSPPGLRNRKRIWSLSQSLAGLLRMRLNDQPTPSPLDESGCPLEWRWVAGDLREQDPLAQTRLFDTGCEQFYQRAVFIPPHLSRVAISLVRPANRDCVTGIRFITGRGPDTCLGYVREGHELFFDTRDKFGASMGLSGLVLAVGSTGVHGIQIIPCAGPVSKWFGYTSRVPKTRRLTSIGSIVAIAACFDVSDSSAGQSRQSLKKIVRVTK